MTDHIALDKPALREFIALMREVAAEMAEVHPAMTHRYARADGDASAAFRHGAKLTLGSLEYDHPGRWAGESLAARVAEVLGFVKSLEEGARALGDISQEVLDELGDGDALAAADLERINESISPLSLNPFNH